MTQQQETGGGTAAQRMFGPQAGVYANSRVHIRDDSLDAVQRLTGPGFRKDTAPYRWAVDIGAGAGFTAFAMAAVSQNVVARFCKICWVVYSPCQRICRIPVYTP